MVEFLLNNAHPTFQEQIPAVYEGLLKRYPFTKLNRVELYEPRGHDTSMAAAFPNGIIRLNSYWFTGAPDRINDAAKRDAAIEVDGKEILWHGPMVSEPLHVLVHEFGHVIEEALKQAAREWSRPRWMFATIMPDKAPSGYALANSTEYFAEAFALYDLGFASEEDADDMKKLLEIAQ
jgi:hypothetical protein